MFVYKIRLSKKQDAEAFATFMRREYFPAVHKGPTRVGQVTGLALFQGESTDTSYEFFWHVGWSGLSSGGPRVTDAEVRRKFDSFRAKITPLGSYSKVAAWHARDLE